MLYLKLKTVLQQHQLTETDLANAIADTFIESGQTVSDRYIRYLANNTEPLTPENQLRKPSLVMLGLVITGLRRLTNKPVAVSDVLEYVPEDETPQVVSTSAVRTPETPPISTEIVAGPSNDADAVLDAVHSRVAARLEERGYARLLSLLPGTEDHDSEGAEPQWRTTSRERKRWLVPLLSVLSLISLGVVAYDFLVVRPRLYMLRGGVFSFRDRLKDTSSLPVPTLIGPGGRVDQLAPILRVEAVDGAVGYEFYVENLVSGDGVYTGPIPNNSFTIPEGTLCPDTGYAWRVRILGQDGWTSFSSPLEFTVTPEALRAAPAGSELLRIAKIEQRPDEPVIIAPIGTTHTTEPRLAVRPEPDIVGYGYYIRDLLTDKVVYNNNFATSPQVQLPAGLLRNGGVYQWNTRARNCHYWSEFTEAQVFTVTTQDDGQTSQARSPDR